MEKIRISLSGPAKCKVPAEYMISYSQLTWFAKNTIPYIAKMDAGKGDELSYMIGGRTTLSQRMRTGLDTFSIGKYLFQIFEAAALLLKGKQSLSKLILSPNYIFIDTKTDDISLLYYPVNGDAVSFDFSLFIKDLVLSSANEDNDRWISWLSSIPAVFSNENSIRAVQASIPKPVQKPQNPWVKRAQSDNTPQRKPAYPVDDSEADTVIDDIPSFSFSDEPDTDIESSPSYGGVEEDDEGTSFDEDISDFDFSVGYNTSSSASSYSSFDDDATQMETKSSYEVEDDGATEFDGGAFFAEEAASERNDGTYVYDSPSQRGSVSKADAVLVRSRTGERYPIYKSIVKIGRSQQRADICISDNKSISNIHAVIQKTGRSYYISDAHSTNGTFIGDRRIDPEGDPIMLHDGSIIKLWDDEFRFIQK